MITLERALADQDDLEALTVDPTGGTSAPNDIYGFSTILKTYSGYPIDEPVRAIIPHGVYLDAELMLEQESELRHRAVLNYPRFRAALWEQDAERVVVPSASPFLYAQAMFRAANPEWPDPRGTIFFAAHTVQTLRSTANWSEVADELQALDERYHPVTVCVHYIDVRKQLHVPFQRRGFRIVCAGHGRDPEFMYRWLHLVSQHRFVASNDIGGAVFYGSKAGRDVLLLSRLAEQHYDPAVWVFKGRVRSEQGAETKRAIAEMFRDTTDGADARRAETVDYLLGAENFKSPEGLRADLEYVASLPPLEAEE